MVLGVFKDPERDFKEFYGYLKNSFRDLNESLGVLLEPN